MELYPILQSLPLLLQQGDKEIVQQLRLRLQL